MNSALILASNILGSQRKLAKSLGISPQALGKWLRNGPPMERCPDVEIATNGRVRCEQLRPDLAEKFTYLRNSPSCALSNPATDYPTGAPPLGASDLPA
ncbi:transcriptional regulator [Chitinimonas taiwanensis]|uniref:transcriptional regulator n=1 Tax=Chitinimonas taiwanensis TaxID=240412 RepID=UPI0035ADB2FB